jgi:hypothetical protein
MKKLLLALALAVVLSGLLAAPAVAAPQFQDGVYIWIYEGYGFRVTDGVVSSDLFGIKPGRPIPAGQKVWICDVWGAYGYGHVESIGSAIIDTLSIDGVPAVSSAAESSALWSVPYPSENAAVGGAFNPRMRIGGWVAVWLYPVTLGPGTYQVKVTQTVAHPMTDLVMVAENHPGPYFYPAGTYPLDPWKLVLK